MAGVIPLTAALDADRQLLLAQDDLARNEPTPHAPPFRPTAHWADDHFVCQASSPRRGLMNDGALVIDPFLIAATNVVGNSRDVSKGSEPHTSDHLALADGDTGLTSAPV